MAWADALGAVFVAVYSAAIALQVLRSCTVSAVAAPVTPRSWRSPWGSTPGLSMAEVERRIRALETAMREEVGNVEISMLASAAR